VRQKYSSLARARKRGEDRGRKRASGKKKKGAKKKGARGGGGKSVKDGSGKRRRRVGKKEENVDKVDGKQKSH